MRYNKPRAQPGSRRVRLDDEPLERQVGREELMLEHRHRKGFEREKQRASRVFLFLWASSSLTQSLFLSFSPPFLLLLSRFIVDYRRVANWVQNSEFILA